MTKVTIFRLEDCAAGTFGAMTINGAAKFVTLERQWKGNERMVSCIPAGQYQCMRVISPKFGKTFEVIGAVGRGDILFHAGNYYTDSLGCILLGKAFDADQSGRRMITNSRAAFKSFLSALDGVHDFELAVKDLTCIS